MDVKNALLTEAEYRELYQHSLENPEGFWGEQARQYLTWFVEWEKVLSGGFDELDVRWFQGGKLNAAYNCLDRHLATRSEQPAIIWESDNGQESKIISYHELHASVCRFANALRQYGIKKGDRVCIYLPMIPEAVIAMLACARIGVIHSVVFGGFSAEALQMRIQDANCCMVITANEGVRGGKIVPLKKNVDTALENCPGVKNVIVVKRTDNKVAWMENRDHWYHDIIAKVTADCEAEIMDAEDPLFILYTSGSTGTPKGILHGTGGYLLYASMTHKLIFDYHDKEIYWCTADVGWITGHSYSVYGPLANGATTLLFEGVPYYPTPARFWEIIDKYKVNIFYTAPTAIRALRREGDAFVIHTKRDSLRVLGTVGEPINPSAWEWYYEVVGNKQCPIVDTWWQTETGGIMISPIPFVTPLKPGSAAWPFFGIQAMVVDEQGKPLPAGKMGKLVIAQPWPGMMQTVYNNHQRFVKTYFSQFKGLYLTGDQAKLDAQGYFWIYGRDDDVLKVSGHRIGTQELESSLNQHAAVAESAVVGIPDEIKGQSIVAFVTLKTGFNASDTLKQELQTKVRQGIGAIAIPEQIQWVKDLPKTRSGKIMRRILRKIATHDVNDMGDLSTLADPGVVESLISENTKG